MVHARIVRPPSYGAQLIDCDLGDEKMPGVVKVVSDAALVSSTWLGKEFLAVKDDECATMRREWKETETLPKQDDLERCF